MLKMQTEEGVTSVISRKGEKLNFPTVTEALNYVWMQMFFCQVDGISITTRLPNPMHPVCSLIPNCTIKRVIYTVSEDEAV